MIAAANFQSNFRAVVDSTVQLATFYVGDLFVGIELEKVQEVNRRTELVPAPGAPAQVRGVVNLRGEVVTVLDLRWILGLPTIAVNPKSRNVVTQADGELIGLLVDRVADIVSISNAEISPVPPNLDIDGEFVRGVYRTQKEILLVLKLERVLS
jgi:purine-binding chemotaxis protein CheW